MEPPRQPTRQSPGTGVYVMGALLVGGVFFVLQAWQRRSAPAAEPAAAPSGPAIALPKPDLLPGGPPKPAPAAPAGDSLSMVRPGDDMKDVAGRSIMADAFPDPPLTYSGDKGPDRFGTRVVRDKKEWDAIWKGLGGHDMPYVDFGKYLGLVVFAGTQPAGTKVTFVSAQPEHGRLLVTWRLDPPSPPQDGTTTPFAGQLVPRTRLRPVFRRARP